jgi:hypothetical protein
MLTAIGLAAVSFIGILWTCPFIFLVAVRVRLFKLTTRKLVIAVSRQVAARSSMLVNNTDPAGLFFGRWYIGYIHETETQQGNKSSEVYLLCTAGVYKRLTESEKSSPGTSIKLWERGGNFFRIHYTSRELDLGPRDVRENQTAAIEQITAAFTRRGHVTAYLHGEPGTGKSMTAMLLAKSLSASLCETFNPTDPGDNIADLYAKVAPTKTAPLIIVLDEVDCILSRIAHDIPTVKYIPTAVKDKASWNRLLDNFDLGMYPHTLVVMTSNKPPEWIERELDASYIRLGRVDVRVRL